MKEGDYVIVTDKRGSYSGTVLSVAKESVWIVCQCCFSPTSVPINQVEVHHSA